MSGARGIPHGICLLCRFRPVGHKAEAIKEVYDA